MKIAGGLNIFGGAFLAFNNFPLETLRMDVGFIVGVIMMVFGVLLIVLFFIWDDVEDVQNQNKRIIAMLENAGFNEPSEATKPKAGKQ